MGTGFTPGIATEVDLQANEAITTHEPPFAIEVGSEADVLTEIQVGIHISFPETNL